MCLTADELATGLEDLLVAKCPIPGIARWAHNLYLSRTVTTEVYQPLMELIAMTEGEQFLRTESELWALVVDLRRTRE